MVALNFNAQQVAPNTALEPIPSGNYIVTITSSKEKPTKKGDGSFIELEMTIAQGEYAGRKVFDRLNIRNNNQTAVDIAYATLSAICHVTGRLQIQATEQLHGIPFMAVVLKLPRDDRPEQMTNEVKGYKDVNGNDPGFAGQVAQPQAQPTWAQQPQQPVAQIAQPQQPTWNGGQPQQQAPMTGGAPTWAQQQPQQQAAQPQQQPQAPTGAAPPWAQQ